MELTFGKHQVLTSRRMESNPRLGRLFHKLFGYTNIGNYARSLTFRQLVDTLPTQNFKKIMDLGCGYGEFSYSLAEALPKASINALDIDRERIQVVRRTKHTTGLKNLTIWNEKIEDHRWDGYDFIFSVDVFEHISPEEMPFQTAFEKLRPGGYLMVKIPTNHQRTILPEHLFEEHNHWLEDEHIGQVYDLNGLIGRFTKEGFQIVHASYSDGWLSRVAWELAYLAKKLGPIGQAASIPLAKLLIRADRKFHNNKWGNAIQVIGKKPEDR